ncbi:hypothetical protein CspHIS471_0702510 [Cutaneotrichosporon sp. HIS471]|nr:hypothetical protein CspHIS471_0702510 [Cutaneotrichosporon sp. HIS471]
MTWTNAVGDKWTDGQLANVTLPKVEVLARLHWAPNANVSPPYKILKSNGTDTNSTEATNSSATRSTKSLFKSTKWRSGYEPTSTSTSTSAKLSGKAASLCVGARNSIVVLVDCDAPSAAVVWGSHRHLAVAGGCLEVSGPKSNTTANVTTANTTVPDGTAVVVKECDPNSSAQMWGRFGTGSRVEFRWAPMYPSKAGSMCLDVTEGASVQGTRLQVWECQGEGHANQMFEFEPLLELNYGSKLVTVDAITLAW